MATGRKKGAGDMVLAGHHLVGLFGLLVVMLGIAFTLGYLLGRNQYGGGVHAAEASGPGETGELPSKGLSRAKPARSSATSNASSNPSPGAGSSGTSSASSSRSSGSATTPANLLNRPAKRNSVNSPAKSPEPLPPDWDFYHSGEPAKPERLAETAPPAQPPVDSAGVSSRPSTLRSSPVDASAQPKNAERSAAAVVAKSPARPENPAAAVRGHALDKNSRQNSPQSSRQILSQNDDRGAGSFAGRGAPGQAAAAPPGVSKLIPHGSTVLQVAAVVRQRDALSLAQALQKKKFPAFVVTPETDRFYRVQVGPYRDAQLAKAAQKRLEEQGFKTIVKR